MTNEETAEVSTRSAILEGLRQHSLDDYFEVADAPRKGWKNSSESVVLRLKKSERRLSTSLYTGFYLAKLGYDHQAYAVEEKMFDYQQYVRIMFICDHGMSYHFEEVEVDTMRNGEHDTYMATTAVCDDCDQELEGIDPPSDDDEDRSDELREA